MPPQIRSGQPTPKLYLEAPHWEGGPSGGGVMGAEDDPLTLRGTEGGLGSSVGRRGRHWTPIGLLPGGGGRRTSLMAAEAVMRPERAECSVFPEQSARSSGPCPGGQGAWRGPGRHTRASRGQGSTRLRETRQDCSQPSSAWSRPKGPLKLEEARPYP